jgi:hypothetical protein
MAPDVSCHRQANGLSEHILCNRGEDRREYHLVLLVGDSVIVGLSWECMSLMYIFKSIYLK